MNKKDSNLLIILGIMLVFLIFLSVMTVIKMNKKKKKMSDTVVAGLEKKVNETKSPHFDVYAYLEAKTEIPAISRDPFLKTLPLTQNKNSLNLMGIAEDKESSYAIINDIIVKVGSVIEGATVLEIQKTKVLLIKDKEYIELQLLGL